MTKTILYGLLILSFLVTLLAGYNKSNIAFVMADVPIASKYGAEWDEVWSILDSSYNGHVRVPFPEYFPFTLTQFYDFGSKRNSYFDIAFAKFTNKMSFAFVGNERIILSRFRDKVTIGSKEIPISFMVKTSDLDGRVHYINLRTLATLLKHTNARFDIQALGFHTLKILRNYPVENDYFDKIPYTGMTYDVEPNPITLVIDGVKKGISAFYWDDKCYVALREFAELYGGIEISADNKKPVSRAIRYAAVSS